MGGGGGEVAKQKTKTAHGTTKALGAVHVGVHLYTPKAAHTGSQGNHKKNTKTAHGTTKALGAVHVGHKLLVGDGARVVRVKLAEEQGRVSALQG